MMANRGAGTTISSTSETIVISACSARTAGSAGRRAGSAGRAGSPGHAGSPDTAGRTGSTSRGWNDGSWRGTNCFKICLDPSTSIILQKKYTCNKPHNLPT